TILVVRAVPVLTHGWGHYIAGPIFKTRIAPFSIGFGRELFGWTDKAGTRWKLSALPFGGYVKFAGDANGASMPSPEAIAAMTPEERAGTFALKPVWQRALIVAAGPLVNFLFAIVIFAGFVMTIGQQYAPARVSDVLPESPAAVAGFEPGDLILSVDGSRVHTFEEVRDRIRLFAGNGSLQVVVDRNGVKRELTVYPQRV